MADSYQNEIPKARVNITLDVETGGARKKTELPLKLLVLGDFSAGQAKGRLAERKRINIHKDNFEGVMKDLAPKAKFTVPNAIAGDGTEIEVDLTFREIKDFHPERVASQVPQIKNLLAMRNLLKDLKANLLDNGNFRRELERIVASQPELQGLKEQLDQLAPLNRSDGGEAEAPETAEDENTA